MDNPAVAISRAMESTYSLALEIDASGESAKYEYDEQDVMNAFGIFIHVTQNVSIQKHLRSMPKGMRATGEEAKEWTETHFKPDTIVRWLKDVTGIDSRKFYHTNHDSD